MVNSFDTDVLVIGGGPAGLAAAIAARRKGLRVMVTDSIKPPIDKACGEGLMPDALEAARDLGISLPSHPGAYFRGIRFLGDGVSAGATFPHGVGWGMRRTALHQTMIRAAESAGVDLRWETVVTGIHGCRVHLKSGSLSARWIVGADGGQSLLRKWAGLDVGVRSSHRFGFRRHYQIAPWAENVEVYWGDRFQIYITPVAPGEVCVALISRDSKLRLDEALPTFPELHSRLSSAPVSSADRGAASSTCRLKRVWHENMALVGDASGSVDAVTGEGLCLAFQQAGALAEAFERNDLASYQASHDKISQRARLMSGLLLYLDRFPILRRRVLQAFARNPELFSRMLAAHVGAPLTDLASAGIRLGLELL